MTHRQAVARPLAGRLAWSPLHRRLRNDPTASARVAQSPTHRDLEPHVRGQRSCRRGARAAPSAAARASTSWTRGPLDRARAGLADRGAGACAGRAGPARHLGHARRRGSDTGARPARRGMSSTATRRWIDTCPRGLSARIAGRRALRWEVQAKQPRRERKPAEESPDIAGRGGRDTDPGKPAGKCHRNTPPMVRLHVGLAQARVKWCGKSAPAPW
jgi:hypothetical protein